MAIDPNQLAEDQEARQRITAAGAPTEFAKGPEQEGIQVAGLGDVLKLLNKLPSSVSTPTPPTGGVVGVAPRVRRVVAAPLRAWPAVARVGPLALQGQDGQPTIGSVAEVPRRPRVHSHDAEG